MSDEHPHPPMGATPPDYLTAEELNRVIARKQFAMQMLADRLSMMTLENAELMSIVQELQRDLANTKQVLADLQESEQMLSQDHPVGQT